MTEHHAARSGDPESSKRAARTRAPQWDTQNGMALRVFYEQRHAMGLTHYMVQVIAEAKWWPHCLGKSPWKRSGELRTEYDPPLIDHVRYLDGREVMIGGEFGDAVEVFKITDAGIAAYLGMCPDE